MDSNNATETADLECLEDGVTCLGPLCENDVADVAKTEDENVSQISPYFPISPDPRNSCFTAMQIDDEDIIENVKVLQCLIKEAEPDSAQFMMDPSRLHITMLAGIKVNLEDPEEVGRATKALRAALKTYRTRRNTEPRCKLQDDLDITGLTTFYGSASEGKVIMAEVEGKGNLAQMSFLHECLKKEFKAIGMLPDDPLPYVPHMTIGFVPASNPYQFPETAWKKYEDMIWGSQELDTIHLLTRHEEPKCAGYRTIAAVDIFGGGNENA